MEAILAGEEALAAASSSHSVILLVVAALSISAAAFLWRHWAEYGGNRIPVYPIVGGLPALIKNRKRIYDWLSEELARCPSHTVKNMLPGGIRVVTTANPANVERILKTNFENYPKGDFFRTNLFDLLGNGIFNADEELWRIQRKASVQEFTTRSLRDLVMESVRGEIQTRLLPILRAAAGREGSVVDLQDLFMRFAFDNICQLAFGVDPACLDPSLPTVAFAKAFDDATQLSTERFIVLSPLVWKIMRALGLGSEKRLAESIKLVDEFAMFVIRKRKEELHGWRQKQQQGLGHFDLLSRFMVLAEGGKTCPTEEEEHGNAKNVKLFSDEFLKDIIKSFLLAGRDTTSSALTYFFWLLSAHPRIEEAIREEISQILKKRLQSSQRNAAADAAQASSFTFEEVKRMNYLHAALTESMRLYPPVPVDTKYAIHDDLWPDGTAIRAGSGVAYHQFAMGRMESIWGADCMEFRPERWLKDGEFVPESPYKYAVFQAGPRICLGKEFAYIQMKLIVAAVMSSFKFAIRGDHDPGYSFSLTLRMVNGLTATVQNRRLQT